MLTDMEIVQVLPHVDLAYEAREWDDSYGGNAASLYLKSC